MRITGGLYNGRKILCPPGEIRPAMDRMRVSLFSILGPLDGLSFLDVFSGSGCVGIEAASRGADPVELVEKDGGKKSTILRNLAFVKSSIKLNLISADKFLKDSPPNSWDVVYLDPPFPLGEKLAYLEWAGRVLKSGGSLLMHYPGEESYPDTLGLLRKYDFRTYGRSHVIFYTKDSESP